MVTVADAGILPDISWYTVCRGSLMGKLLANLKNTDRRISYYIDKSTITEKRGNPIIIFFFTLPCHDPCMCPIVHLTGQQQGVAPKSSFHGCF